MSGTDVVYVASPHDASHKDHATRSTFKVCNLEHTGQTTNEPRARVVVGEQGDCCSHLLGLVGTEPDNMISDLYPMFPSHVGNPAGKRCIRVLDNNYRP
jgi:hypothetical protein